MNNKNTFKIEASGELEIAIMRVFDAPRNLIFDALTKPELVKSWLLGPPGWSMPVCEIDLKVDGTYHYEWLNDSDGERFGMSGTFREIGPNERLVHTERFEGAGMPGESLVTTVLTEKDGQTTLSVTVRYESREARDAMLASGMEQGAAASYDRLDEMVSSGGAENT